MFRPRPVVPRQQVHTSVFAANAYTPRATLTHAVGIPTASVTAPEELWTTELADEEATTHLRESQLYWSTLHLMMDIMDKVTPDVPFPNILGYLSNVLPRLDVEGGVSSADNVDDLPFVLRVNGEHQTFLCTL